MSVKYTTVANLYQVVPMVGSLTDITSATLVDRFIADAESVIDAKLAKSFTLPFSLTGVGSGIWAPALTAIATDLALYRVLSRRIFTQEQLKDSAWPDRFKESMKLLEEIASGETTLVTNSGDIIPDRTDVADVWSNTMGYLPTNTELDPEYNFIDPDKLEDLANERDS